ncbi:MAG: murein biosynthesis integral membrane protein MurJ [Pseudomonadota bacterium]
MALFRSLATVGGFTGISRVLGFVRDILIADVLGTGPIADAFFVAFRLPNMFRRIVGEGAFNAAFVPLFSRRLEQEGEAAAKLFAEQALAVLLSAVLALTAVAIAAMPLLMHVLAPGFPEEPGQFDLAVEMARVMFPYLLFMSLVALLSGVLNALHRFAAAAAAPILLNIFLIVALAAVIPLLGSPGRVLAWTVAGAGLAQFLVLMVAAGRAGMALRLIRPRLTAGVRRLGQLMGPGVLSAATQQVMLLVGTAIATLQAEAVSYLYYADRIYQLPLGLIGIAFGVVLLPDLSRKLRSGQDALAMERLNRGLEMSMVLTLPAAVALLVIAWPIVVVLFERGAFTRESSDATALALQAFAFGLPAFVLVKILQPAYFAREDTMTPFKITVVSVAAYVVLALGLFWWIGFVGLAVATTIAAWLSVALLAVGLRKRGFFTLDQRLKSRIPRILAASVLMGLGLWLGSQLLAGWIVGAFVVRVAGLALLVGGGLALYGALGLLLGVVELSELKALLRRRGT